MSLSDPQGPHLLFHIPFLLQESLPVQEAHAESPGVSTSAPAMWPPSLEHGSGRKWEWGGDREKQSPLGAGSLDPETKSQFLTSPLQFGPVDAAEKKNGELDGGEDSGEGRKRLPFSSTVSSGGWWRLEDTQLPAPVPLGRFSPPCM